jgi:nucleotide-binding universal stress UspA family protein
MKTLFVATDFSNAAHNALVYSLAMAKPFGAKVIVFHAYQIQVLTGVDTAVLVPETDTKAVVEDRLRQHLLAINESEVDIELLYSEGPAAPTILATAVAKGADMIVSGMKDHGKTFRQFFGSTVTALAKITTLPFIVVPEAAGYQPPLKIALASDIAPETDTHILDCLASIGERFHSKLYIVRVIRDRFEEVLELKHRPARLDRLSPTLETAYTYTQSKHVPEALDFFIHAAQINLLAMVPHKHTLLEKWFFKSNTKAMIFRSDIPLLILPEGERQS